MNQDEDDTDREPVDATCPSCLSVEQAYPYQDGHRFATHVNSTGRQQCVNSGVTFPGTLGEDINRRMEDAAR